MKKNMNQIIQKACSKSPKIVILDQKKKQLSHKTLVKSTLPEIIFSKVGWWLNPNVKINGAQKVFLYLNKRKLPLIVVSEGANPPDLCL